MCVDCAKEGNTCIFYKKYNMKQSLHVFQTRRPKLIYLFSCQPEATVNLPFT